MTDLTELAELIRSPIWRTWDQIGADVLPLLSGVAESERHEASMEMVLEAGRLLDHGGEDGEAAQALLKEAFEEHGWTKVVDTLARLIPLDG